MRLLGWGFPVTAQSHAARKRFAREARAAELREQLQHHAQLYYVLDNEHALWHSTHRDVHPEPAGMDAARAPRNPAAAAASAAGIR